MKKSDVDYTLYLCTDRGLMNADTLEEAVEKAISGGCTVIQLREKDCSSREFYEMAVHIREITRRKNVPLIINDRVDIAQAVDADGVHLGQDDLPVVQARRILGPDKIIGVSVACLREAQLAVQQGADYLGVGAMYATNTKTDADATTIEELRHICSSVDVPVVAIGGINRHTAENLRGTGISGFAVVSAVLAADDIEGAARELAALYRRI